MKIVNILGGLGNQMFQYAFAIALRERFSEENVRIDPSGFKGYPLHNGYELLRIFSVSIPEASFREQLKVYYPLRSYRMWQIGNRLLPQRKSIVRENADMRFTPSLLSDSRSAYYLGYWQTEKYFRDIRSQILEAFTFPPFEQGSKNEAVLREIQSKNVIGVHVRRGDYVNIGNTQGICTLEYYRKALCLISERTNPEMFLIFSDDIEWCRNEISKFLRDVSTVYVDWNKGRDSFRDMQLMSCCRHNIIANSSFSWWGAWLNQNPDKIVIAPSRWMNDGGWVDIIPEGWLTLE